MKALWQVILAILWRLRPVQALEVNLRDIIQMGLSLFADDDAVEDLANDPSYRRTIAAALADAHRKLDLLIYLRACELTNTRHDIQGFSANYSHTHASTDLIALWRTFHRLIARFDDYERCAIKRAERLKRENDNYPLRLAASLQSTSPMLHMMQANHLRSLVVQIAALGASHLDGMARHSAAKAAGGCVLARGPPLASCDCPLPTADCLEASAFEIAPARPIQIATPRVHTCQKGRPSMRFVTAFIAATALAGCATAQPAPTASLAGKWTVDLSTSPSEPYTKAMELNLSPDGTVTGSFYDSEIQAGRWKTDRGRTCVSFRTTDGAGPYHSAACLNGSGVQGQTWAEHRNFLFNWNAVRAQ